MIEYTTKELSNLCNITNRTIRFYLEEELLTTKKSFGKGKVRRYNSRNLSEIKIIRQMTLLGIRIKQVKYIMKTLKKIEDKSFHNIVLIRLVYDKNFLLQITTYNNQKEEIKDKKDIDSYLIYLLINIKQNDLKKEK